MLFSMLAKPRWRIAKGVTAKKSSTLRGQPWIILKIAGALEAEAGE